jgi:hypothetical protein
VGSTALKDADCGNPLLTTAVCILNAFAQRVGVGSSELMILKRAAQRRLADSAVMAVTAVATSGRIPPSETAPWRPNGGKASGSPARTSDPCTTQPAHKPGKPHPLAEPPVTALPGETVSAVALSNKIGTVPLLDWPHRHPLALPTVIRTVNIVLPNGATLGPGIRDPCASALSHGTGYRNLAPNRDRAQADDDSEADQ